MPSEACGLVENVERAIAAGRNFVALVSFWSMYTQIRLEILLSLITILGKGIERKNDKYALSYTCSSSSSTDPPTNPSGPNYLAARHNQRRLPIYLLSNNVGGWKTSSLQLPHRPPTVPTAIRVLPLHESCLIQPELRRCLHASGHHFCRLVCPKCPVYCMSRLFPAHIPYSCAFPLRDHPTIDGIRFRRDSSSLFMPGILDTALGTAQSFLGLILFFKIIP